MENRYKTNHKNNYVINLGNGKDNVTNCIVNAPNGSQAIYLAIKRYKKTGLKDITRARVKGIYPNKKKTIKKRIVLD